MKRWSERALNGFLGPLSFVVVQGITYWTMKWWRPILSALSAPRLWRSVQWIVLLFFARKVRKFNRQTSRLGDFKRNSTSSRMRQRPRLAPCWLSIQCNRFVYRFKRSWDKIGNQFDAVLRWLFGFCESPSNWINTKGLVVCEIPRPNCLY